MAYDSYDKSRRSRAERYDQYDRGPNSYDRSPRNYDRGYDRSERDFFDRASDEVKSWFGDERADHRREMDERFDERRERMDERWDMRESRSSYRPYGMRTSSRTTFDRSQPETGFSDRERGDRGFTSERWAIGPNGQIRPQSTRDDDYTQWREREMSSLDRDYDEYRRERQARFTEDFGNWRQDRMTKRQTLAQVSEHMDVVGNDGEFVGKVDKVRGDNVILTKSDSWDEKHHTVPCSLIQGIEDGKLTLNKSCEEAKRHLENSTHERFLFEERNEDAAQPHMLNRSFSGTY